jgi:hypothetical protein
MKINLLINYSYGDYKAIETLLNEISVVFQDLVPDGPLLGDKEIDVIQTNEVPMTFPKGLPVKYTIGITSKEYFPLQITYQFAHELCHVFIEPRLTNWLIESFCECMSLIILELTGADLKKDQKWVINYTNYIEEIKIDFSNKLNLTIDDLSIIDVTNRVKSLTTPYDRPLNFVSAWKIYNLYKKNPEVLHLIPYLNYTRYVNLISANEIIEDVHPNLINFQNNIPDTLLPIWKELKLSLNLN